MRKEQREIVQLAQQLDFKLVGSTGGGHIELKHRSGQRVTIAATPSEYRGRANTIALLERIAGRKLPRARHKRSHKSAQLSGFALDTASAESKSWHAAHDCDVDALRAQRDAAINRARAHAQRRDELRLIPPLLTRITQIEKRLRAMGQPVETFDPFTLSESE